MLPSHPEISPPPSHIDAWDKKTKKQLSVYWTRLNDACVLLEKLSFSEFLLFYFLFYVDTAGDRQECVWKAENTKIM